MSKTGDIKVQGGDQKGIKSSANGRSSAMPAAAPRRNVVNSASPSAHKVGSGDLAAQLAEAKESVDTLEKEKLVRYYFDFSICQDCSTLFSSLIGWGFEKSVLKH